MISSFLRTRDAALSRSAIALGPVTLQGPTVGLGGFGFADGKLVLSVIIGVQRASLAFGGNPTTGAQSTAQTSSGVTVDLDPVADDAALRGGEDHALLACFSGPLPEGFGAVGRIVARGDAAVTVGGEAVTGHLGWDPHHDWDAGLG